MTTEERVKEHYIEALQYFQESSIVMLALQGSQNYTLDIEGSDVDTKLIVAPSFRDIVLNKKPVSTTHVRQNSEHIDFKDVRLYMETFRKQNLNFLEILFTDFSIINPIYFGQWSRLLADREKIARMNPNRAVKSMKGVAMEKFHAMEHPYPTKLDILAKYGYDPKQLHHLVRVDNYLTRYIAGESYKSCLIPEPKMRSFLLELKHGEWDLAHAKELAKVSLDHVTKIADEFCEKVPEEEDSDMRALLEDVQYEIMKIAVEQEIK